MIARVWRTRIDESRAEEYRRFARLRSLPMFREQPGFIGVMFGANLDQRAVVTLWRDASSARRLDRSASYKRTVAEIEATGFLRGESTVEEFELEGFVLQHEPEDREGSA